MRSRLRSLVMLSIFYSLVVAGGCISDDDDDGPAGSPTPTPLDGTPTPLDGTPTPLEGTPTPLEGTPTPLEGTPTPLEGTPTPLEGTPTPLDGTPTPLEGTPTPLEGTPTPLEGTPTPLEPTPVPGDTDGDGYTPEAGDCDDADSSISPAAPELCDGKDNDCDGAHDEGFPDADGDSLIDCIDACPSDPDNDADGDGRCAGELPPDPATVAPPLDQTVPTSMAAAVSFLYTGRGAIQSGVSEGTIRPEHVAVIRGRVVTPEGTAVPAARVSIDGHPEYGYTWSRADGVFDLAVNGGDPLTLRYEKPGYVTIQRQARPDWQRFAWLEDVVLVPYDHQVTVIDFSAPVQVAQGSPIEDEDGLRQATLLFPQGTRAAMRLPDGSEEELSSLSVRATEFTVGPSGPRAMPGELPATIGYTYALELSVDEALDAGATQVTFSQPVPFYLENFLGFPVGTPVPTGYYDRARATWVPVPDGLVIEVLSSENGTVELDLDGSGLAAEAAALAALGITDAELRSIASLYLPGQTLWRVSIDHFTPYDCNFPVAPPPDSRPPPQPPPRVRKAHPQPEPDCQPGSIIDCQNQVLGETLPVFGTPWSLHYRSDRVPGRQAAYQMEFAITGETITDGLRGIELEVTIAGRRFLYAFEAATNLSYTFTWDGRDAYGRTLYGEQPISTLLTYYYDSQYLAPGRQTASFGGYPQEYKFGVPARQVAALRHYQDGTVSAWDARAQGIGGWTLSVHHAYDPIGRVLYLGDGSRRSAVDAARVITTIAGDGGNGNADPAAALSDDGGPATGASLFYPGHVALDAAGSVYFVDGSIVRKVRRDGILERVAGDGTEEYKGDGGPATEAGFYGIQGLALDHRGLLYLSDGSSRVRRIDSSGMIDTVVGNGVEGFSGDGGPATEAQLFQPHGLALDGQGNLFISDYYNQRVRRVDTAGTISTVAGGIARCCVPVDNIPATDSFIYYPEDLALDAAGNLYIAGGWNHRVRKVDTAGIITTIAGTGWAGSTGDGGPATDARVYWPSAVTVDKEGNIFFAEKAGLFIRRIDPDGIISTVAGTGAYGASGDGGPAVRAPLGSPAGLEVDGEGNLYIGDSSNFRVRKVGYFYTTFTAKPIVIPSEDGGQLFAFDAEGRHLETRDALTGRVIHTFRYDAAGRLVEIEDASGRLVRLERNAAGEPLALVGPYGHRTALELDSAGFLRTVTDPEGGAWTLTHTADGLLTGLIDPEEQTHSFEYDADGLLTRDEDPAGGYTLVARQQNEDGFVATLTSALGRVSSYQVQALGDDTRRLNTDPAGAVEEHRTTADGLQVTRADGTRLTRTLLPDPRYGMQAPYPGKLVVTTPAALTSTSSMTREVSLADPRDLLSVTQWIDTTEVNGRVFTRTIDPVRGEIAVETPEGRVRRELRDGGGRTVQMSSDDSLEPAELFYDSEGRLLEAVQGDLAWRYSYDGRGRIVERRDGVELPTRFSYDEADRLTGMELPSGRTFEYLYDSNGNRTEVVMPAGNVHTLSYTAVGLPASYSPPGNSPYSRHYDLDRQLIQVALPGGRTVDNAYDSGGRLISSSYEEARVDITWAGATRRLDTVTWQATDAGLSQTVAFQYDGALVTRAASSGTASSTFNYRYDKNFFLTGVRLDDLEETTLSYDADGQLTGYGPFTLTRGGPAGTASRWTDGRLEIRLAYDELGRPAGRTHTVAGRSVYGWKPVYDASGRIAQLELTIDGQSMLEVYTYDDDGQLIGVSRDGVPIAAYDYDLNGNRTRRQLAGGPIEVSSYDDQDRLLEQGEVAYEFDEDGFLTRRGGDTFYYSARGELLEAVLGGGARIVYEYDGLGRRVTRSDAQGTTQYLYGDLANPFRLSAMRRPDGALLTFYYDEVERLVALHDGAQWYYVATDQTGTPKVVADAAGEVVKVLDHDAFGALRSDSNPELELPIGFAGGLLDPGTGLVTLGYRDYDPATGRWTSRDPLLFTASVGNLYVYARNSPVSYRDGNGMVSFGVSFYAVLGVGLKLGWDSTGASACLEFGVGLGESVELDPFAGPDPTAVYAGIEAKAKAGVGAIKADVGLSYKASRDIKGCNKQELALQAKAFDVLGVEAKLHDGDAGWVPGQGGAKLSSDFGSRGEIGESAQVKAAVGGCVGYSLRR